VAYNDIDAARVRDALAARKARVAEKKMMGGLVFMVDDHMCVGLAAERMMVRVGEAAHDSACMLPHARAMEFGKMKPRGFVFVDHAGWATAADLGAWLDRGLAFVATLPAKKAKARKPPKPKAAR